MLADFGQVPHRKAVQPEEVETAICEFVSQQLNLIVVNGGDGTIHAALTALYSTVRPDRMPSLALLRSGTTSMIARDVGLPGSKLEALSRLLSWLHSGSGSAAIINRPVLRLDREMTGDTLFGMFFGAGAIYDGIKFCHAHVYASGVKGELAAGLTLARFLFAAVRGNRIIVPATSVRLEIAGQAGQDMAIHILFVTTLERLFLGMRPYWGVENAPLHFTTIRSDAPHVIKSAPYVLSGHKSPWSTSAHGYLSHNLHELRLSIGSGFTMDGQLYESVAPQETLLLSNAGEVEFLIL
jgi:hypothetical protein